MDTYYDKNNYASLWLCEVDSEEILDDYVSIDYEKEDGEIPFGLGRDFNIRWYDEDFFEFSYSSDTKGWDLLVGHSYMDDILSNLIDKFNDDMDQKFNGVILLYNKDYEGNVKEIENQYGYFKFVGSFKYR